MNVFASFFAAAIEIIDIVLGLYVWLLIIGAILSWLVAFDVINTRNRLVQMVGDFVYRITEPALRPIRRFIPALGGVDVSPLVLILLIMFLRSFLRHLVS
ncbi:MAG: YggT family protein [Alphaproteobacteria bacterium]|nr:YggT family protein [Alphaproteobacteria bacterium]